MKRFVLLLLAALGFIQLDAQGLQATLGYKMFYAPGKGNFIEIYASFNAATCHMVKADGGNQATIEALYILRKDDKIIDYRKKNLLSPVYKDSVVYDFLDQDRMLVEEGPLELEVQYTDLNKEPRTPIRVVSKFVAEDLGKKINISDIELLEQFGKAETTATNTKAGYTLIPFVSNFYSDDIDKIAYYAEVYMSENAREKNGTLLLYEYIEDASTGKQVEGLGKFQKVNPQEVITCLHAFDITALPTGDYNLVVEIKNKENEVLARKTQFWLRANAAPALSEDMVAKASIEGTFVEKMNDRDSLTDFIASLRPIGHNLEISLIDRHSESEDMISKKQFLYSFWVSRNPENPEKAWLAYKSEVNKVNKLFSTRIKRGYDTERGRVYLKYGPPNQIVDRPSEPSAYPYQIWHYYKAGPYSNKRFVFYMPDLVTNDYDLLHSDVFGEYKNYRWEYVLHSRNSTNTNIDSPGGDNQDHYGGNSKDYYRFPR